MQKALGTDVALYLVFLRLSSMFFGVCALFNIAFFILFTTGKPKVEDNFRLDTRFSVMTALTILNITDTEWKVILTYLNCMIVIVLMMVFLKYNYSQKYENITIAH